MSKLDYMSQDLAKSLAHKIHVLVILMDRVIDEILKKEFDIGLNSFLVLHLISLYQNITQKTLANYLNLTPAAISKSVFLMKKNGWLEIQQNPQNRKENHLTLTQSGKDLVEKANKIVEQNTQILENDLSVDEVNKTDSALDKMLKVLNPQCPNWTKSCS